MSKAAQRRLKARLEYQDGFARGHAGAALDGNNPLQDSRDYRRGFEAGRRRRAAERRASVTVVEPLSFLAGVVLVIALASYAVAS